MKNYFSILFLSLIVAMSSCTAEHRAARQERKAIKAGNELYNQGRFAEAAEKYKEAIDINPNSMEALYDLSLASLKRAETVESDSLKQQLTSYGMQGLSTVAMSSDSNSELVGKANYNLGNFAFEGKRFPEAIADYKQALRHNPMDNDARRNLRIAQLQKNDDQDQDNENNENDQNEQEQEQEQDQNQQQNQDQQQDQQEEQQPQINNQSAEQILQSIDNRENQIRARMMQGKEAASQNSNNKRW